MPCSHADYRFAICSQGRTASYWLAGALDAHPMISCGHSRQNPPIPNYRNEQRSLTLEEMAKSSSLIPNGIDEYYDLLNKCGDGPFYGTVHTFAASQKDQIDKAGVKSAMLTRHPIARCDSYSDRSKVEMEMSETIRARTQSTIAAALEKFPAPKEAVAGVDEIDWVPFVAACFDISQESRFLDTYSHVLPSERLTGEPDYMAWFLYDFLKVPVTSAYLDDIYSRGKLNTLAGFRKSATSIFSNWPDWKKEVFRLFATGYPIRNFQRYGYDIEGIINSNRAGDEWIDRDAEAIAAMGSVNCVVRNLGQIWPDHLRCGTAVDVFIRARCPDIAIVFGGKRNTTILLHAPLPDGPKIAKISFDAPKKPGAYLMIISEARNAAAMIPSNFTKIFEAEFQVKPATTNLPDHGLLRTMITVAG